MSREENERKKQRFPVPVLKFPRSACPKRGNPDPQSLFLKRIQNCITFIYFLRKIPLIRISWVNECQLNLNFSRLPIESRLLNPINTSYEYIYMQC